jgi:hypothetical protein
LARAAPHRARCGGEEVDGAGEFLVSEPLAVFAATIEHSAQDHAEYTDRSREEIRQPDTVGQCVPRRWPVERPPLAGGILFIRDRWWPDMIVS